MNNPQQSNERDPYNQGSNQQNPYRQQAAQNNNQGSNQSDPYKQQPAQNYNYPNQDPYVQMNNEVHVIDVGDSGENEGISDISIRMGFIKKVYGILIAQLLFNVCMIAYAMTHESVAVFQKSHPSLTIATLVVSLIVLFTIICYPIIGRKAPLNYILLFLFTISFGYMLSFICTVYDPRTVVMAAIYTLAITLALTFYSFTTKTDFTVCGNFLFAFLMIVFVSGFFLIFTHSNTYQIIFCGLWALVYSVYLIYDTQVILGKFGLSISPDDYIFASMTLYIDIIGLFMRVLECLGINRN